MYVLLPLFGVAVRGNATVTIILLALVIPYHVTPVLALTRFTHVHFCYPFFTPFGITVTGKGNPKIASIGHSVLGNPKVRYDTGFSIVFFYINTCHFCYPFLLPLLGLRVKPSLRYLH